MKPYPSYKPTNIQWIGDIPEHWDLKKLKFLGESIIGITYSPDEVMTDASGVLVLRSSNIQNGVLAFEDCVYVKKEIQPKHFACDGDILLCARNGSAHLVGKCVLIDEKNSGSAFGAFMSVFRSQHGKFLYYFFNSQVFKAQTGLFSTSTINQLTLDTLNNMFAAMPSDKEEQTAIANYLDQKTALIDTLIADKQKLIELLKEERIAIINETVSLPTRLAAKRAGKAGGEGKGWEKKKLKYIAKNVQTGNTPPSNEAQYYSEEVNWYTPSDFSETLLLENAKRKISELAISEGVTKMFPANSVLFIGIGATIGKVGYIIEPASSNQQINCISFQNEYEAIFYVNYFYSNKANIVSQANAATLAILNQSQMKEIILPVPSSIDELKIAVQKIQSETQRIDDTISNIENEIELLQEYRTALISEVVTGKIKVV